MRLVSFVLCACLFVLGLSQGVEAMQFARLNGQRVLEFYRSPSIHVQSAPTPLVTPLGSVWKLFVYAYLVETEQAAPEYRCDGKSLDEVYCCSVGQSIEREDALIRSCGLFFTPERLNITPEAWRTFWAQYTKIPWLLELSGMNESTQVSVQDLLMALDEIPSSAKGQAQQVLIGLTSQAQEDQMLSQWGTRMRVKTWTMPNPKRPGTRQGGAAGWLADGSPVWLQGDGSSHRVLVDASDWLAPIIKKTSVNTDTSCVLVHFFARYPVKNVLDTNAASAVPGRLVGRYQVNFERGTSTVIESKGELSLLRQPSGELVIVGRLNLNDYVARVIEREGSLDSEEAAKALGVVVRTYLLQEAERQDGCYQIDDSTQTQRVLAVSPHALATRFAEETDHLILIDTTVMYHRDQSAPGQMSWTQSVDHAKRGDSFVQILSHWWPQASLTSYASSQGGNCTEMTDAQDWLEQRLRYPSWKEILYVQGGYQAPTRYQVCLHRTGGNPYADRLRQRIYIKRFSNENDRVALVHEYLHIAFAQHPAGQDEGFVEDLARQLVRTH